MEEEAIVTTTEIRKLRKKLRQIDNLERQSASRDLTESETAKVSRKLEIRDELKLMLADGAEVEVEQQLQENEGSQDLLEDSQGDLSCDVADADDSSDSKEEGSEGLEEIDEDIVVVEGGDGNEVEGGNADEGADTIITTVVVDEEGNASEQACEGEAPSPRKKAKKRAKKKVDKGWENRQFTVTVLEGHHHPVCAVDANDDIVVSGGYDTAVRVWDAKTGEEKFSMGGHVGCVTSILLLPWGEEEDKKFVASGSLDCSVKVWNVVEGTMVKSLYVFSPVRCLTYGYDLLAVGNEGGKVQLLNLDTNATVHSVNCHDDAVTCIKFLADTCLATGSEDGEVKVFSWEDDALKQVFTTEDGIRTVSPNADVSVDSTDTENQSLRIRSINCMESFQDYLIWGDDGFNVKVLDWKNGTVTKIRNNLFEFCPTEALKVLSTGTEDYLFSSGFDLDNGNSYINVRSLPSCDYVGTVSTSSLGHINSIAAVAIGDGKVRLTTGGSELKVWHQVNRTKKRRGDALDDLIPCKYNCSYNTPRESEDDLEENSEDAEEEEIEDENQDTEEESTENPSKWCVIS